MRRLSSYRYELYERWEMRRLHDERFGERLRHERCRPPRLSGALPTAAVPLGIMCAAYWFGGALDALVAGLGLVLPALVYLGVGHIVYAHLYDVTMLEAIKSWSGTLTYRSVRRSADCTYLRFSHAGKREPARQMRQSRLSRLERIREMQPRPIRSRGSRPRACGDCRRCGGQVVSDLTPCPEFSQAKS